MYFIGFVLYGFRLFSLVAGNDRVIRSNTANGLFKAGNAHSSLRNADVQKCLGYKTGMGLILVKLGS